MTSRSAAKSSFFLEILASQKLDRGRVVAKSKRLVAVAEEEIKRWGNTAFSLSLPSFFYSKSQLLYQALQGSCGRVHQRRGALVDRRGPGVALVPGGNCLGGFFSFSIHTKRSQLV